MTRIALIDPYATGHHVDYAVKLASGLVGLEFEVCVIGSQEFTDELKRRVPTIVSVAVPELEAASGVRDVLRKLKFTRIALAAAQAYQADVIHFLYLDRFILPLLGSVSHNCQRLSATLHWGYFLNQFASNSMNRLKSHIESASLKRLLTKGLTVMVHSHWLAKQLEQALELPSFRYVPYPAEPTEMTDQERVERCRKVRALIGIPQDVHLLLLFGGTRYDKGADLAVQALADLPQRVHILIAGKEECFTREFLVDAARKHGVEHRLHLLLDRIMDEEVLDLFVASDAILLPYRHTFAGQSGPLTIAAAQGVPVVASNVPILLETVLAYDLGIIFDAENIQSMISAVRTVFSQYRNPVPNHLFCARHSLKCFTDNTVNVYQEIMLDSGRVY